MRVGIVEDNSDIMYFYRVSLKRNGHVVVHAFGTGQQALDADWSDVDAAIVDYAMPGTVHGGKVMEHLERNYPSVRRVLATAYPAEGLDGAQYADVVLQKPFDIHILLDSLGLP